MLKEAILKLASQIHSNDELSEDYCKAIVKTIVKEIYRVNPDKKTGRISVTWYDIKMNKTPKIDSSTYCFEVNFHDICTDLPWLICRFYSKKKAVVYCCN